MRKRVALFANGWGNEYLRVVGSGVLECAKAADVDVFSFINFSAFAGNSEFNYAEFGVFCLPDLKDFDGVIMLPNSFNSQKELDFVFQQVKLSGLPAVSLEYTMPDIPYVGSENYQGMYDLTKHLVEEHHVGKILFVAGSKDHPESEVRLKAVLDAARENKIRISSDDIIYGQWAAVPTVAEITKWAENHNEMPDAVICANDVMAKAVCNWLKDRGYDVPKDVKVTGYDCISAGQLYHPVITTVTHEWDKMGYMAMDILLKGMRGEQMPSFTEINTSLVSGESCGCDLSDNKEFVERRRVISENRVDGFAVDQHFRHLYRDIRKDWTAEGFSKNLSDFIVKEGWVEGKSFILCLAQQFFSYKTLDSILKDDQIQTDLLAVCIAQNNVAEKYKRVNVRQIMFEAANNSPTPDNYIFVPLSHDEKLRGFAMLSRDFSVSTENLLYIWTRHMNQCLEQVRANVKINELNKKLEMLSVTDMLTGVYNRTGCEKLLYPLLVQCQNLGGRSVLLLVDVDNLKMINDIHGHVCGDEALCTSVEVIQNCLPNGYLIGRFGGDEFLVVGEVKTEDFSVEKFSEELMDAISKVALERKLGYPLSASIGGVLLERGEKFDLAECLQRADDAMYSVKRRHHRRMD